MKRRIVGRVDDILAEKLRHRKEKGTFRKLFLSEGKVDFFSNDYLGYASVELPDVPLSEVAKTGATGSRLLSGNSSFAEKLEQEIAAFHKAEAGLLFNSGFDANLGLLSCIARPEDTILYDELCHASMLDGLKLSRGKTIPYRHNDIEDVKAKTLAAEGQVFIATESVFSMDGDVAPLADLCRIRDRYGAELIVDEAHGTGVFGPRGEGLVVALGLESKVFDRVHTYGKAAGCHGAIVLGSKILRDYLTNYARSFIYTTALPPHSLQLIQQSYQLFSERKNMDLLHENINYFKKGLSDFAKTRMIESNSPIQCYILPGNERIRLTAKLFLEEKLEVRPIVFPTVPKGGERIRICLHSFNTKEELNRLTNIINGIS